MIGHRHGTSNLMNGFARESVLGENRYPPSAEVLHEHFLRNSSKRKRFMHVTHSRSKQRWYHVYDVLCNTGRFCSEGEHLWKRISHQSMIIRP